MRYEARATLPGRKTVISLDNDGRGYTTVSGARRAVSRCGLSVVEIIERDECGCAACDCADLATTTDDAGTAVCAACADYVIDPEGKTLCSQCDGTEYVTDAGNKTRLYLRLVPPERPPEDPEGQWACYWYTTGDDAHVVSRHATRAEAEQAVAAYDWPKPWDHTQYRCGYEVRVLVNGLWII